MRTSAFKINQIPAILWGEPTDKLLLAVHGNKSHKADTPIRLVAEVAAKNGYQVLSFDFAKHGERSADAELYNAQSGVADLTTMMAYAKTLGQEISLFANSMGAYYSLIAFQDEPLENALFLSPVVDMKQLIENMMKWFDVTTERLKEEQVIDTPIGETLYWDYYSYVLNHPIVKWQTKTAILYGEKDEVAEKDVISRFSKQFDCDLKVVPECPHYFHTPEQLKTFTRWLESKLSVRK